MLGLSGLAFAAANLLLARVLPKEEFGRFALLFSIIMIGQSTGPLGANVIVNRYRIDPGRTLLNQVIVTSVLIGVVLLLIAAFHYPLDSVLLVVMFVAITAGGAKFVALGHYQSRQRHGISLALYVSTNAVLVVAALVTTVLDSESARTPALILALGMCVAAVLGWLAIAFDRVSLGYPDRRYPWRESLSLVGLLTATLLLNALDRLVIPSFLSLQELATFGVLATIVGWPFQVLHQGVSYA